MYQCVRCSRAGPLDVGRTRGRPKHFSMRVPQALAFNGLTVTEVRYNIRSSTRRLTEHLMVPPEVFGGQERVRSTKDGREVDRTTSQCACQRRSRNGLAVTEVMYNIRSSTRRLPENNMVSIEVCDGREQARSTSGGREVDQTTRF